jgi:hypothetical protein
MKYIDLKVFLVSFLFGLFIVYVLMPNTSTVYVYPTPDNIDVIQYQDRADNCFSVKQQEVECPTESGRMFGIPMQ